MRNLLSIEEVDRDAMEAILGSAESFAEVGRRDIKKVPTLRGRTVVTLFYESSTRTRWPAANAASTTCDPMNPAPPVTSTCTGAAYGPRGQPATRCCCAGTWPSAACLRHHARPAVGSEWIGS